MKHFITMAAGVFFIGVVFPFAIAVMYKLIAIWFDLFGIGILGGCK